MDEFKKVNGVVRRRVVTFLTRDELEFLDKLSDDASFSTGRKLSRTDIISTLVRAAMAVKIEATGIRDNEEFLQRILNHDCDTSERRKFPRLHKNLHVSFRKMDTLGKFKDSATKDIGVGGLCMEVESLGKSLFVNNIIEILLEDMSTKDVRIKAMGRVAWIRKKKRNGYDVGVMLTYLSKKDKEAFHKFAIVPEKAAKAVNE